MRTPLETANVLTQIAIRSVQQSIALQTEVAIDVLRVAVELLGHDECIRRIESMRRQSAAPPPNDDD